MQLSRNISGQNFVVTGAARGIGLAISTLFSNLGARISGWDIDAGEMRDNSVLPILKLSMLRMKKQQLQDLLRHCKVLAILMALLLMLALTDRPSQCGSIRWKSGMLSWK